MFDGIHGTTQCHFHRGHNLKNLDHCVLLYPAALSLLRYDRTLEESGNVYNLSQEDIATSSFPLTIQCFTLSTARLAH